MPRPTTKDDLISAANEQFQKLLDLIDSLPEEAQEANFHFDETAMGKEAHWKRDQNIRDVFIHLYEWHQLFLNWVYANQKGEEKSFLPESYNWKTYGNMNIEFWKKHQSTPYKEAKENLEESHQQMITVLGEFSNEALFTKGFYQWTGGTTLGSYGVSATSSHYDWAIKKIKKYKKSLQ